MVANNKDMKPLLIDCSFIEGNANGQMIFDLVVDVSTDFGLNRRSLRSLNTDGQAYMKRAAILLRKSYKNFFVLFLICYEP